MKNKNIVSSGLLLLIIVLIIVAGTYYFLKKDNLKNNKVDEPNVSEKDENKNNQYEANAKVKTITTYEEFKGIIERSEDTLIVLGRTGCHYCEMFLPNLKSVSGEYGVEIFYVDFGKMSEEDYNNVIAMPLAIPSKCTKSGEENRLSDGFGTPLSLFVRESNTYDCIRGYKDKNTLAEQLKSIGYIK